MGTFRVSIQIGRPGGDRFDVMEALVDTGASYTWIPRDVLEALGVRPDEHRVFVLADGREISYPVAWVRIGLDERSQPTLVVCGDPGTEPLVGAFTLEGFGLGVDPVNRRLIRVPGLLKTVACPDSPDKANPKALTSPQTRGWILIYRIPSRVRGDYAHAKPDDRSSAAARWSARV
jgi:clan AA aspartic protease